MHVETESVAKVGRVFRKRKLQRANDWRCLPFSLENAQVAAFRGSLAPISSSEVELVAEIHPEPL